MTIGLYLCKCSHFHNILDDIDNCETQRCFYSLHLRHMYGFSAHIRQCLQRIASETKEIMNMLSCIIILFLDAKLYIYILRNDAMML